MIVVTWPHAATVALLLCSILWPAAVFAQSSANWIVIGSDGHVFEANVNEGNMTKLGVFGWNDTHYTRLVLTGPMRAYDADSQTMYVVVSSPPAQLASRIVAVSLGDASVREARRSGSLTSRESPVFDFFITGLHFCAANGTLIAVTQTANGYVGVVEISPSSFSILRVVHDSQSAMLSLGATAYNAAEQSLSIQVLSGFTKYVATVDLVTGATSSPARIPFHFFGFEYSNISNSVLAASGSLYSPVVLYSLDPVSGALSDSHTVAQEGSLFPPAVGFDPVTGLFCFTGFNGDSTVQAATLTVVDTTTTPFSVLRHFHCTSDAVVMFPLAVCV